jgi:hypothetical protein
MPADDPRPLQARQEQRIERHGNLLKSYRRLLAALNRPFVVSRDVGAAIQSTEYVGKPHTWPERQDTGFGRNSSASFAIGFQARCALWQSSDVTSFSSPICDRRPTSPHHDK